MSELHDQLIKTIRSDAFTEKRRGLSEEAATAFGALCMKVAKGESIEMSQAPTHIGPRILSEQEFLELTPQQLAKLDKYEAYVESKMAKAAEAQQASAQTGQFASAAAELERMREQTQQASEARLKQRERLFDTILQKVAK